MRAAHELGVTDILGATHALGVTDILGAAHSHCVRPITKEPSHAWREGVLFGLFSYWAPLVARDRMVRNQPEPSHWDPLRYA